VVSPDSADVLARAVGSKVKRVIWYERSGHVLPMEPDAAEMFEAIAQFIEDCTHLT
jgi:esterase/lipase